MTRIEQEHSVELEQMEQQNTSKLEQQVKHNTSKLEEMDRQHASKLEQLEQQCTSKLEQLELVHANEMKLVSEDHNSKFEQIEDQMNTTKQQSEQQVKPRTCWLGPACTNPCTIAQSQTAPPTHQSSTHSPLHELPGATASACPCCYDHCAIAAPTDQHHESPTILPPPPVPVLQCHQTKSCLNCLTSSTRYWLTCCW